MKFFRITNVYASSYFLFLRIVYFNFLKNCSFLILTEHLGDIISCTSIPEELYKDEKRKLIWIVNKKYAFVLKNNPYIYKVVSIQNLGVWIVVESILKKLSFIKIKIYNLHFDKRLCNYSGLHLNKVNNTCKINSDNYYKYGSLVEVFSQIGGLKKISSAPKLYISNEKKIFDGKYIVIHTTSNESTRNWNIEGWNSLVNYILSNSNFSIIEIGFINCITNKSNRFTDFTGHREMKELINIIYYSYKFIGIDSSFAHVANAYRKPSFILLGKYRMFLSYMPYSGYFKELESSTLFRFNGNLNEMNFSTLFPVIKIIND